MTWKISFRGLVQGVGFRPFVWRAALERNLKGSIANDLEGVVVMVNGHEQQTRELQEFILHNAPTTAHITRSDLVFVEEQFFDNFTIEESVKGGLPVLILPPDVALCLACRKELHDPLNRRKDYAFTTCTVCGPRFSIITGVPYDRPQTTMRDFTLCHACLSEYVNPDDRRFYAQTNSCAQCGVQLQLLSTRRNFQLEDLVQEHQIVQQVMTLWQQGAIIAIKGIGGYLLTCDATNPDSIAQLRTRKHRPTKPFALMYPTLETLEKDVWLTKWAADQLQSAAAPIVLLPLRTTNDYRIDRNGIAPGLNSIGAMLPNAPLLELLLHQFGRPIVATSGNISHHPLVFEDKNAIQDLSTLADAILLHNREIIMPQDDSVCIAPRKLIAGVPLGVVIRRARGLAPSFLQSGLTVPDDAILALGAELKSTFTLAYAGNLNISQYLGDLSGFDTQQRYQLVLEHLMGIFKAQPKAIVGDLHPGYFTTNFGNQLSETWSVPFYQVQHHEAHFAAILAENNLIETGHEPVLGVIWDGTGLGSDGQIWGGEFFVLSSNELSNNNRRIERLAHFDYFPQLLGDKMPKEPRISALAVCRDISAAQAILEPKFSSQEWNLYQKMAQLPDQLMTSSAGRMFDAAASLLGLADQVSYEGEAAMLLEAVARRYCEENGFDFEEDQPELAFTTAANVIKTEGIWQQIIQDIGQGKPVGFIAAKFHSSMVKMIQFMVDHSKIRKVAFSGGVFQNTLLLDMIDHQLSPHCQLFFHKQLSPNDENISFGQWAHYTHLNH